MALKLAAVSTGGFHRNHFAVAGRSKLNGNRASVATCQFFCLPRGELIWVKSGQINPARSPCSAPRSYRPRCAR
jgi:hypothetical protein